MAVAASAAAILATSPPRRCRRRQRRRRTQTAGFACLAKLHDARRSGVRPENETGWTSHVGLSVVRFASVGSLAQCVHDEVRAIRLRQVPYTVHNRPALVRFAINLTCGELSPVNEITARGFHHLRALHKINNFNNTALRDC